MIFFCSEVSISSAGKTYSVMPGLDPGIHVSGFLHAKDADGGASGRLRPSSTGYARP
jgi:hypothetical protein